MAMFEQTPFEEAGGSCASGGGIKNASNTTDFTTVGTPPAGSSSRRQYDVVDEADGPDACARCGTVPVAIQQSTKTKRPVSVSTSSFSPTESSTNSEQVHTRSSKITNNNAATSGSVSTSPSHSETAMASSIVSSEAPMVGMRGAECGGVPGAGRAAEPVRGLKAFGSNSDLSSVATEAMTAPTSNTQLDRKTSAQKDYPQLPPSEVACVLAASQRLSCKCGQGKRSTQDGANGSRGGGPSSNGNKAAGRTLFSEGSSPVQPSGVSGGEGAAGVGKNVPVSTGAGSTAGAAVPLRNPGYRVLQWSDLTHLTYITAGAMCEIYSAEVDGVKVAVKVPRKDCEEPAVAEHDLEVELDVLKRVSHKHIIALVGAGLREEKPHRFLALEYLELGTLADKLDAGCKPDGAKESTFLRRQKRTKRYQDFYMVTMLERSLELAMALEHLHHHMPDTFVVHRDLKPDNVGFKADGTLKLFDFGLARVVKRRNRVNARYEMTGETGSMRYMAPEVVESLPYNEKVDVYAFGLLLWEMLEDRRVFDGMGVSDFYERVVNAGARPNLDPAWPQDLRRLISQCWHADVDRRPNFRTIADRLRVLYNSEKQSSKLCMSALNLNEDERPKIRGGSSVNMLPRSATTTNIVSPRRGGGPSSQTEIGKKSGVLRRSFNKIGRILKPGKGGAKATLVHTAPEAHSRPTIKGRPGSLYEGRPAAGGGGAGEGHSNGDGRRGELSDEAIYGEGGKGQASSPIMPKLAYSDGMIANSP